MPIPCEGRVSGWGSLGVLVLGWSEAVGAWCRALRAAARSPETVKLRRAQVLRIAAGLDVGPWEVTTSDLLDFLGAQVWKRDTLRSHRAALRSFYAWAVTAGHVATSPALGLPTIRPAQPRPRPTPDLTYRRAMDRARGWERLALRLGAEAGLRRAEIAQVHADDLLDDLAGTSLRVHGKGDKVRLVPLSDDLARAVRVACQDGHGFAFPGRVGGHVSPGYLGKRVSALMPPGVTTHSLRHRFATRAYGVDRDMFAVQELLGHASPETTRRYVQVNADRLRHTVNSIAS